MVSALAAARNEQSNNTCTKYVPESLLCAHRIFTITYFGATAALSSIHCTVRLSCDSEHQTLGLLDLGAPVPFT